MSNREESEKFAELADQEILSALEDAIARGVVRGIIRALLWLGLFAFIVSMVVSLILTVEFETNAGETFNSIADQMS